MKLLDGYLKNRQEIYNYFGFVEDWVVPPLDDFREYSWMLNDNEVLYGAKKGIIQETGNYYSAAIYKQRFYDRWVYRGEEYAMIMIDTQTDGNKYLAIFDNSKELNEDDLEY